MTGLPDPPPLRVLYVVSLFPCWSETFIAREIATLVSAGVDVRILSLKPPSETLVQADAAALLPRALHPRTGLAGIAAALGACLRHPLATSAAGLRIAAGLWRQPVALAKSLGALARGFAALPALRAFDPHYVHAHWGTYPSTVGMAMARVLRRPFGFTAHAHDIFVDDHLLKAKLETARLPVTISRYNIDWLAREVTPLARERLRVVHCGVDLARAPFVREGREPALLLAVGRLDPIKGFDVLLDALARLAAAGVPFRCRIIGEGPRRPDLEAAIARLGLADHVELAGACAQDAVQAALRAATLFVLPCVVAPDGNRDGIPVALMEAMAAGTPVVSTHVSGIPELVADGSEGLLVPPGDAAALAAALVRLLQDAPLREQFARAARARIEREFDARHEALRLLALVRAELEPGAATAALPRGGDA
jgi:glycosyltransferase involved in cell wall biosynthesis